MTKPSVAAALIAQVDFNISMMKTVLEMIELIPGATDNQRVIEAFSALSSKSAYAIEQVKLAVADIHSGIDDGG